MSRAYPKILVPGYFMMQELDLKNKFSLNESNLVDNLRFGFISLNPGEILS